VRQVGHYPEMLYGVCVLCDSKEQTGNIVEGSKCRLDEGQVLDLNGGTEAISRSRRSVSLVEVWTPQLATVIFMLPCIVIDFFLNNQPDALIIPNLFCYKTLHVSGIFSAHHQEFYTVHSALVSFMQGFDDRS
jgi:hypothetical protein